MAIVNTTGLDGLELHSETVAALIEARGILVIVTENFTITFSSEQIEAWNLPEDSVLLIVVRALSLTRGITASRNVLHFSGIGSGFSIQLFENENDDEEDEADADDADEVDDDDADEDEEAVADADEADEADEAESADEDSDDEELPTINDMLSETVLEIQFLLNGQPIAMTVTGKVDVDISGMEFTTEERAGLTAVRIDDLDNDQWSVLPSRLEGDILSFYATTVGLYSVRVVGLEQLILMPPPGVAIQPPIYEDPTLPIIDPILPDIVPFAMSSTLRLTVGSSVYQLDGQDRTTDLGAPFVDPGTGRTMVPIRFIAENLGAEVDWNPATRVATLTRGSLELNLSMAEDMFLDGQNMGRPANVNGLLYVPLAYVAHYFGVSVEWDGTNRAIYITIEQ